MAMDKLQLSLIGLGSLGLIALFGYSKWQELRARRHAENVFGAEHRDVLLDEMKTREAEDAPRSEPLLERVEPIETAPAAEPLAPPEKAEVSPPRPAVEQAETLTPTLLRAAAMVETEEAPALPAEVDARVDCVLRFEPDEPLTASEVLAAYARHWPQPVAGVRWFGLPEGAFAWRALASGTPGRFAKVVLSLQLASRAGPRGVADWDALLEGASRFARQIGASLALPDARMLAHQAVELDRFCASVDVMIGVNVVAHEQPFAGTKIRGLAEAAGMKLGADGVYRAFDETGAEMFGLASLERPAFSQESLRTLQTRGLTLTLDVPRAQQGRQSFERMLAMARQLAEALKGRLVDDNHAPLAEAALVVIREQIGQFQKQMSERAIPPGSPVALRVFS